MNKTESLSIIKDFITDILEGDINRLPTYDIKLLKNNKKFGTSSRCSFDPDNTIIVRAIMYVVFGDVWPGLTEESLRNMDYRGDTINTFNTMFGPPVKEGGFQGLNRFSHDISTERKVHDFYSLYTTIGNIIVLPNKPVGRYTLNTFRGTYSKWRDYFDRFLENIRQYLIDGTAGNETFSQLMKSNEYSFTAYNSSNGFVKLCQSLLLDDYIGKEGEVKHLFPLVYWWNKSHTNKEYLLAVNNYIDFAEPFILNRGKKIVGILSKKLS